MKTIICTWCGEEIKSKAKTSTDAGNTKHHFHNSSNKKCYKEHINFLVKI